MHVCVLVHVCACVCVGMCVLVRVHGIEATAVRVYQFVAVLRT